MVKLPVPSQWRIVCEIFFAGESGATRRVCV